MHRNKASENMGMRSSERRLSESQTSQTTYRVHRTIAQIVLLGSFGLDLLLYSLVVPFLPGEAQRVGATPLATGALFAMYAAGLFLATPFAAWLTDHVGPRRTLLWGLLALAAATLVFAFSPTLALGLPGLFVARGAQGVASTLTWTAGLAILVQLYPSAERSKIFARAFTVTGLAALLGPPLGGVLYTIGGFQLPFLVATALVCVDGLGRLVFLPGRHVLPATRPERGATRILLADGSFRMGLFVTIAGACTLSALEPATPLLLGGVFGLSSWGIGVVFGALALCFVIAQPLIVATLRRFGAPVTIRLGLVGAAVVFVAITLVMRLPWATNVIAASGIASGLIIILALLAGVGFMVAFVLVPAPEVLTQRGQHLASAGGTAYGAIYAAYNAAYGIGILLGPVATGSAVSAYGIANSYLLLALAPAIGSLVLLFWRGRHLLSADAADARQEGK